MTAHVGATVHNCTALSNTPLAALPPEGRLYRLSRLVGALKTGAVPDKEAATATVGNRRSFCGERLRQPVSEDERAAH